MPHLLTIKMIIIGEPAVGKTAFIREIVKGDFSEDYQPTIGANFFMKQLAFTSGDDQYKIGLTIWDIAGQREWREMRGHFYERAQCAFVIGDLSRKDTFEQIAAFWIPDLQYHIPDPIPMILIGNKSDLNADISEEEIASIAERLNISSWFKVSAKTGKNVKNTFLEMIKLTTKLQDLKLIPMKNVLA